MVVCDSPDVCLTPQGSGMAPVPYSIVAYFSDSAMTKTKVFMRGEPVFTVKSHITRVQGDEAGVGGGQLSGVNLGQCRVVNMSHTLSVRAEGEFIVYNSSKVWMNCSGPNGTGNTVGTVIFLGSTKVITDSGGGDGGMGGMPENMDEMAAAKNKAGFMQNLQKMQKLAQTGKTIYSTGQSLGQFFGGGPAGGLPGGGFPGGSGQVPPITWPGGSGALPVGSGLDAGSAALDAGSAAAGGAVDAGAAAAGGAIDAAGGGADAVGGALAAGGGAAAIGTVFPVSVSPPPIFSSNTFPVGQGFDASADFARLVANSRNPLGIPDTGNPFPVYTGTVNPIQLPTHPTVPVPVGGTDPGGTAMLNTSSLSGDTIKMLQEGKNLEQLLDEGVDPHALEKAGATTKQLNAAGASGASGAGSDGVRVTGKGSTSSELAAKKKRAEERKKLVEDAKAKSGELSGDRKAELDSAINRFERNNHAVERARLADAVYGDGAPTGWSNLSENPENLPDGLRQAVENGDITFNDPDSGFAAALYQSDIDGSTVLVYRGTENLTDWGDNFTQGLGLESEQYTQAISLAQATQDVYDHTFEIAGHSLGGGLGGASATVTGVQANIFNAAGVHPNTLGAYGFDRGDANGLVNNHYVTGEVLTTAQNPLVSEGILAATGMSWLTRFGVSNAVSLWRGQGLTIRPMQVYQALGDFHQLDAVDAYGDPMSIFEANPIDRHGMNMVVNGMEKQKREDMHTMNVALRS